MEWAGQQETNPLKKVVKHDSIAMLLTGLLLMAVQDEVVSSDKLAKTAERASDGLDAPSVLPTPDASKVADLAPRIVRLVAQLVLYRSCFGTEVALRGGTCIGVFDLAFLYELVGHG